MLHPDLPAATPSDLWDRRASAWLDVTAGEAFVGFRREMLAAATIQPGEIVLDVGCGTGPLAIDVARLGARVTGIDRSPRMLELARAAAREARVDGTDFRRGDMRRLPVDDRQVDVVLSCYAFHHLPDDGKELAAADAFRVLRPGGRLVVADMMFELSLRPRDRAIIASKAVALMRKGPSGFVRLARNAARVATGRWEHPASTAWWQQMLEARGFDDVNVRALSHEAGLAFARRQP